MSALAASSFPVARPTGVCAATGRTLAVGERYVAALVERPGQPLLERIDFSIEAWEQGQRPHPPLRLFGLWRSTIPRPGEKQATLLSDPELLELFEELAGATEARQLVFRYLLALLLVRRRVLKMAGTRRGVLLVRYKPATPGGPEQPPLEVVDPDIDDRSITDAIEELGKVIGPADR
jgi:hypothetical protein